MVTSIVFTVMSGKTRDITFGNNNKRYRGSMYIHMYNVHTHTHPENAHVTDTFMIPNIIISCRTFEINSFLPVNAYIKHMGGKHRLINKFMTPELLTEYSKLPTSEAEFQVNDGLIQILL